MKTRYILLSIIGLIIVAMWMIGVPLMGAHPIAILAIPFAIIQMTMVEGNGVVCFDSCGPCASWGENYLPFEDGCRLPESVDDCNLVLPNMEWEFMDNKCVPLNVNPNTVITLDGP
ncbi:MAG: hypothetical protein OEL84_06855 [Nitrosopumilus sp.]|nr:hypothetical protein [Nitrosopumilus sp.]